MPFSRMLLHADLLKAVKELGFTRPTPIQEQAIPPAAEGRDLLACAATGSGKTAAFVLPILNRLRSRPRGVTRALILTPTRELAAQIVAHLEELAVHTPVTGAAIYGGVGMGPQEHALRSGVDVIVATPGRLLDHLRRPYARLSGLEILVLDEADRMLDMGFLPDIRRILKTLPAKRQTLCFSATIPPDIARLVGEMLHQPVTININVTADRRPTPAVGISHAVYPVARDHKPALLLELLARNLVADAIVFTRTKHRADRLARLLARGGISAAQIHGNRSQNQRTAALAGFKAGRTRILVATDIVARGIDIEALGHVINFDVPSDPDAYIHRVGRTARAEARGDAFTFVAPEEEADLRDIEKVLGRSLPRVTLPDFDPGPVPVRMAAPAPARGASRPARRGASQSAAGSSGRGGQSRRGSSGGPGRRGGNGAHGNSGGRGGAGGRGASRVAEILDRHAPLPTDPTARRPRLGGRRRGAR